MVEIIPAILPQSFTELREKMAEVEGLVTNVQIDVCDGIFVPAKTWPYQNGGDDPDFDSLMSEAESFPFWQEIDFEADLMVANPELVWRKWLEAGAKRLIFHIESTKNIHALLKTVNSEIPGHDSFLHVEIGIAINISTPNEKLNDVMNDVDFVQFMGINRIGFQGEAFDEQVLEKISDLREKFPNATISVDGGVNLENAPLLLDAGVDRLAVGSAIFGSEDPATELQNFLDLVGTGEAGENQEED